MKTWCSLLISVVVMGLTETCLGARIYKLNNTEPVNTAAAWKDGLVPGADDTAAWGSAVTTGGNLSPITQALTWDGMEVASDAVADMAVYGSVGVTFDGGASPDFNILSHAFRWQAPLTLSGASSSQLINIEAGALLAFESNVIVTTTGDLNRRGLGTFLIDGGVTSSVSTSLILAQGTNIWSGKYGGICFSTNVTSGARFYIGRPITGLVGLPVSTLIISNGVHYFGGIEATGSANLIGAAGASGRMVLENGRLDVGYLRVGVNSGLTGYPSELTVNNGTLAVRAGLSSGTFFDTGLALGVAHDDNASTDPNAVVNMTQNNGVIDMPTSCLRLGGSSPSSSGTVTLNLNGGILRTRYIQIAGAANNWKTLNLNGGTLVFMESGDAFRGEGATATNTVINLKSGGFTIDTSTNRVRLVSRIRANAQSRELKKLGNGELVIAAAQVLAAPVSVQSGTLSFEGAGVSNTPALRMTSGAVLSLQNTTFDLFSPASFSTSSNTVFTYQFDVSGTSSASDCLVLPAGTVLGTVLLKPVVLGTMLAPQRSEEYTILRYAGGAPDVSRFVVQNGNPFCSYTCRVDTGTQTVLLRVENVNYPDYAWVYSGSGNWEETAKWSRYPTNQAGTAVQFLDVLTAPATLTLAQAKTVGAMAFLSGSGYQLEGAPITLDNGAATATIVTSAGSNTVTCALTIASPWLVGGSTNAWLSLLGPVQGSSALSIQTGNVVLQGSNQLTGPVGLDNASLIVSTASAFPQGPITVTGGGNSRLRYYGADRIVSNAVEIKSASFELAPRSAVLTHAGNVLFSGSSTYSMVKYGAGEFVLAGTGTGSAARIQLDEGPLRFAAGANYVLGNRSERDTFRCTVADKTRAITIDEGAFVQVSGIYSEAATSFLLQINGQLRMTGAYTSSGAAADEVALVRANGWGNDLVRVAGNGYLHTATNAFFSLGVRGGSGAFGIVQVTNNAVAEIGRLCLGVRADVNGVYGGAARVEILGGRLTVANYFNWMGDTVPYRTNYVYLGNGTARVGTLETVPTSISVSTTNNYSYLYFNGGILSPVALAGYDTKASLTNFLNGLTYARVLGGGAYVDTKGLDLAILQSLEKVSGVTDGGLTKSGMGMLTVKGTCTFTGKTTVEAGTLSIPAVYASTAVEVAEGSRLDLVNGQIATNVFDTVTFQNNSGITFEVGADGSCDSVQVTGVATMGTGLALRAVRQGTREPVLRAGTYTLMRFTGAMPDSATWSVENPAFGRNAQLVLQDSALKLVITESSTYSIWKAPGSGNWETAANWNVAPASADTTAVLFDDAITAPAVVTVNDAARLLSMTFNHGTSYTVSGSTLTFADGGTIAVRSGKHSIQTPVVADAGLTIATMTNTELGLGSVTAVNNPVVNGGGVVVAAEPSQFNMPGLSVYDGSTVAFTNTVSSFNLPLAVFDEGGRLSLADTQTVTLASAVFGTGNFTKAGVNIVHAGDLLQQDGATTVEAGTLTMTAAPRGRLALGDATAVYAGTGSGNFPGLTIQAGSQTRAATLDAQSEIVITASVSAPSGALIKKGPATVRCVAAGTNIFHTGGGAYGRTSRIEFTEMGSSPATGFGGLTIAEGALEVGAAGQVNSIGGEVVVGAYTTDTAGAEKDATLRVLGGTTTIAGNLSMGINQGTTVTAPTGAVSRVEVSGGATVLLNSLRMGYSTKTNNTAIQELTIADGSVVTASEGIYLAMQTGSVSRISVSNRSQLNLMTEAISLRLGELGGRAELTLDNSDCTCLRQLIVGHGKGSTGILRARNGARIRTMAIARGMDSSAHSIYFDGATLQPLTNDVELIQNPATIYLGAGGVTFDVSSVAQCRYAQTMVTDPACSGDDGGLTKVGSGILSITGGTAGYRGATRFLEGGVKLESPNVLTNASVVVGEGVQLYLMTSSTNVYGMKNLALGVTGGLPAKLNVISYFMGDQNAKIAVAQTLTLGRVDVELFVSGNDFAHLARTYPLLTYTGTAPDVSGLRYAAPVAGRKYTFEAKDGVVALTISPDAENTAIWTSSGSGTWSQSANWSVAPGAGGPGMAVSFDRAITAPATVSVDQAATFGRCYFNNTNAYTLQGVEPLTFAETNGSARLTVMNGSPVFNLPVDVGTGALDVLLMNAAQRVHFASEFRGSGTIRMLNGGELVFGVANASRSGTTDVRNGVVVLDNGGTPGRGEVQFNHGSLNGNGFRVTGTNSATLHGAVRMNGTGSCTLNTQDANLILQGGAVIQQGTPMKTGTNQLTISTALTSSSSSAALVVREGTVKIAAGTSVLMTNAANESIRVGQDAGSARLVIDPNSSVVLAGLTLSATSTTITNDAVAVQNGGAVVLTGAVTNRAAFSIRDMGSQPGYYELNAGTFTTALTGWTTVGDSGDGYLSVNGGVMTLGQFLFNGFNTNSTLSGRGFVTVNGGVLEAKNAWYWGSRAGKARYNRVGLMGGQLILPATSNMTALASTYSELALNGGSLVCSGTIGTDAERGNYLKGLRRLVVDAAGGTLDVRGNDVTIRQPVQTRFGVGTLSKVGSGALTLSATNSIAGALRVQEGVLRAQFRETRIPGTPLLWYAFDQNRAQVETANDFSTTVLGNLVYATDRKSGTGALACGGTNALVIGTSSVFENTTNFTVMTWIKMSAIDSSSNQSLLSSRPDTTIRSFELKINSTGELRLLLQSPSSGWWNEIRSTAKIPLNQWVHIGVVVTPQGAQMYFNGVAVDMVTYTGSALVPYTFGNGFYFPCDCRLNPVGSTVGLAIGRSTPSLGSGNYLKSAVIDELLVYDRALTSNEVVVAVNESQAAPQLMLGAYATYDGQGASLKVSKLSGVGTAINGTIDVQNGMIDVGLAGSSVAGDTITVDQLVLGTNVTYACTSDGTTSDIVVVQNQLAVGNHSVIALDLSQVVKVPEKFKTTVMTYTTLSNSAALATWKVTGLNNSYVCSVIAEAGAIKVDARSFPATVILLR